MLSQPGPPNWSRLQSRSKRPTTRRKQTLNAPFGFYCIPADFGKKRHLRWIGPPSLYSNEIIKKAELAIKTPAIFMITHTHTHTAGLVCGEDRRRRREREDEYVVITFALKMRKVMFWLPCIYLFICMRVTRITQEVLNQIAWKLVGWLVIIRGPFD